MSQVHELLIRDAPPEPARPPTPSRSTRVVLVDDHPMILAAVEHLLAGEAHLEVVASCRSGEEALHAVDVYRPDIVLLDIRLPGMDGIEVARRLKGKSTWPRVVLLTAALDEERVLEAVRLGVDGLLLKDVAPEALVRCLRRVAAGEPSMDRGSMARVLQRLLRRETAARELARDLSEREIEIVRNVASGARNREVADRLHISEGTVKVHLHNIYEKLGVKTRVQLTIYAGNKGLV